MPPPTTYDPNGQLLGASLDNLTWAYDAGWNLTRRAATPYTVNDRNPVTYDGVHSYGYDASGNRTWKGWSSGTLEYAWDDENRLIRVQTDTYYTPEYYRWRTEFVYDGRGRLRVRRDYAWQYGGWYGPVSARYYYYDGMLLLQERSTPTIPLVTYARGLDLSGTLDGAGGIGGLLARYRHATGSPYSINGVSFYHADGNGNVTWLASPTGGTDAAYRYDPFGRWLSQSGPWAQGNIMRFSSKPWFAHNYSNTDGLYYYGYRFYDPLIQRWLNWDPIGEKGGRNLYTFCRNAVTVVVDPDGRLPKWAKWSGGGVGIAATVAWYLWRCEFACERWREAKPAAGRAEANVIAAGDSQQHEEGSPADALAHCIASCKLAREPGPCETPLRALDSLQRRETAERLESRMDMWNNLIGYTIGAAGSGEQNCGAIASEL